MMSKRKKFVSRLHHKTTGLYWMNHFEYEWSCKNSKIFSLSNGPHFGLKFSYWFHKAQFERTKKYLIFKTGRYLRRRFMLKRIARFLVVLEFIWRWLDFKNAYSKDILVSFFINSTKFSLYISLLGSTPSVTKKILRKMKNEFLFYLKFNFEL